VINAIRAHLAFGIVAPVGRNGVEQLIDVIADSGDQRVPEVARLGAQLGTLKTQILEFDRRIMAWHRSINDGLRQTMPVCNGGQRVAIGHAGSPLSTNALDLKCLGSYLRRNFRSSRETSAVPIKRGPAQLAGNS
jgi:hypothetical protein